MENQFRDPWVDEARSDVVHRAAEHALPEENREARLDALLKRVSDEVTEQARAAKRGRTEEPKNSLTGGHDAI